MFKIHFFLQNVRETVFIPVICLIGELPATSLAVNKIVISEKSIFLGTVSLLFLAYGRIYFTTFLNFTKRFVNP